MRALRALFGTVTVAAAVVLAPVASAGATGQVAGQVCHPSCAGQDYGAEIHWDL